MSSAKDPSLLNRLAQALPLNSHFNIYHISSPPTLCAAIYPALPQQTPEKTFCESHFLSVTISSNKRQLQVFALEVLIFTTKYLTTLFVSKADSTGFLHLLKLPQGTPSPLKTISTVFLAFLVETRQRSDRRLVLSLFARAQDQYLFPGSIENSHKHVLDDRRLVKWWCQVLDPILREYPSGPEKWTSISDSPKNDNLIYKSKGFLRVPGCDLHETRAFFPKQGQSYSSRAVWSTSDPLSNIGRSSNLPIRCLIPRFPDDPKARYVEELDDELPEPSPQTHQSPSKGRGPGRWRSVKSLEYFWEMMAFRQECSSGRLVGFLWGVFTPLSLVEADIGVECLEACPKSLNGGVGGISSPTPSEIQVKDRFIDKDKAFLGTSFTSNMPNPPSPSSANNQLIHSLSKDDLPRAKFNQSTQFKGPVINWKPRSINHRAEKTRYYYWPTCGRGELVLREKDYQRINRLMLHLDYSDEENTARSTNRWVNDVAVVGRIEKWGNSIEGKMTVQPSEQNLVKPEASTLDLNLMRRKRRNDDNHPKDQIGISLQNADITINNLPLSFVRKKAKIVDRNENPLST